MCVFSCLRRPAERSFSLNRVSFYPLMKELVLSGSLWLALIFNWSLNFFGGLCRVCRHMASAVCEDEGLGKFCVFASALFWFQVWKIKELLLLLKECFISSLVFVFGDNPWAAVLCKLSMPVIVNDSVYCWLWCNDIVVFLAVWDTLTGLGAVKKYMWSGTAGLQGSCCCQCDSLSPHNALQYCWKPVVTKADQYGGNRS